LEVVLILIESKIKAISMLEAKINGYIYSQILKKIILSNNLQISKIKLKTYNDGNIFVQLVLSELYLVTFLK